MKNNKFLIFLTFPILAYFSIQFMKPKPNTLKWINNLKHQELLLQKQSDDLEVHFMNYTDKWVLNFPNGYSPEKTKLNIALKSLKEIKALDSFEPIEKYEEYGLGPNAIKITVRSNYRESIFYIGSPESSEKAYLKFQNDKTIHLIDFDIYQSFVGKVESWVDKRLTKIKPDEVESISAHVNTKYLNIPGFSDFEKIVLWDLKRTEGNQWQDLSTDLPVSGNKVQKIIETIGTTEGERLNYRDFLSDPAVKISIKKYDDEKPLEIMLNPYEDYWASWGDSFGGFYMEKDWKPDLILKTNETIYRNVFLELEDSKQCDFEKNGESLSSESQEKWTQVFSETWPEGARPANVTNLTKKVSLAIRCTENNFELNVIFYPNESIVQFSKSGIIWNFPEEWWNRNIQTVNE
ncbi:hypothetical protein CL659_01305 [bacterium]|nr:hypothetical protein [bacterium]|tara:strand:- start:43128 stop:44345 length:1218 start_codon:yes stop_codon:yes gene_type:complete